NRVISSQVQIGRLCRDLRYRSRVHLVSAGVRVSGGDFGGPVSASKNSVPDGQGSATDIRLFVARSQTSAAGRDKPTQRGRRRAPPQWSGPASAFQCRGKT